MTLSWSGPGTLALRRIPSVVAEILRAMPSWHAGMSLPAEERMFPSPSDAEGEDGLRGDWKAHVQPGLHEGFRQARDVVAADLRGMKTSGRHSTLAIPLAHVPEWINAANQARLALAATHGFDEGDMAQPADFPATTPRQIARLRMDVLASLQEALLAVLED
jgi:hypothetical protein